MTDDTSSNAALTQNIAAAFALKLPIGEIVARKVPTSYTANATFFLSSPNALYVYIQSEGNMLLADVRAMLRGMNVEATEFMPPHGDKDYFKRIGERKFKEMFPGKHIMSDDDTRYYRTLAPYSPALVRVERVKGDIRGFHTPTKTWRKVKDYSFSRINL